LINKLVIPFLSNSIDKKTILVLAFELNISAEIRECSNQKRNKFYSIKIPGNKKDAF